MGSLEGDSGSVEREKAFFLSRFKSFVYKNVVVHTVEQYREDTPENLYWKDLIKRCTYRAYVDCIDLGVRDQADEVLKELGLLKKTQDVLLVSNA